MAGAWLRQARTPDLTANRKGLRLEVGSDTDSDTQLKSGVRR